MQEQLWRERKLKEDRKMVDTNDDLKTMAKGEVEGEFLAGGIDGEGAAAGGGASKKSGKRGRKKKGGAAASTEDGERESKRRKSG